MRASLSDGGRDLAFATHYLLLSGPFELVTALGQRFKSSVTVLSAQLMSTSAVLGRPLAAASQKEALGLFTERNI